MGFQIRLGRAAGEPPLVIGPASEESPPGTVAVTVVQTKDGDWYGLGGLCTHRPAVLSEGFVEDCQLECPRHGARFDLATGGVLAGPATEAVATYQVVVADDVVYLEIEPSGGAGSGQV